MKYFHCPKEFRRRPYGCGYGPISYTAAFWDSVHPMRCPKCGQPLKVVRSKPRQAMTASQAHLDAAAMAAQLGGPKAAARYVATHRPRK